MGMKMRFTADSRSFEVSFPPEVSGAFQQYGDVLELAGASSWPGKGEPDWDCSVLVKRLRIELMELKRKISDTSKEDIYNYTIYKSTGTDDEFKAECSGSGGIFGIRIDGERYGLTIMGKQCLLRHIRVRDDGEGEIVSEEDVGHLGYIDTDNMGRIRIKRKKVTDSVTKWINKVLKMLDGMEGDVVVEIA